MKWAPWVFVTGCGLVSPSGRDATCDLREVATAILEDYVACGDFTPEDDPAAGISCAEEEFLAGERFLLVVAQQGIDSVMTSATVFRDDRMLFLTSDSFDVPGSVDGRECVDPFVEPGQPGIQCGSTLPWGDHYYVCGWNQGSPELPEPWASVAAPAIH